MSAVDQAGSIIDQNANSRTLSPTAVGSQVLLMTLISVVTVLVFNFLRPKNKVIYEPKVKYHVGKPPPRISDSIFGWISPLIRTKEPELLDKIGLDAVTFLRFLRLMRWLFSGIAALTCVVLIPINVSYNLRSVPSANRDVLSMLTIRDVAGEWLYVHVAVSYLITFLTIYVIWVHWKEMVRLRHTWFRSPEYAQSFYARTLTVMHVPKKLQDDKGIAEIFEFVKVPYPTTSVHIGRKVGDLPDLIEYHNRTVREFEEVLVKYLKGGKIAKNRPMITIGGTWGMGGTKKDAIEFYTAKLKRTEAAVEAARAKIDERKAENYGFASMAAVPYAHIVANMLRNKHPKGTDIALAPNPKDIIWENMNKTDAAIARKRTLGFTWLVVVCFFNTFPLFVISILANLASLTAYVPFLQSWADESPTTFAIVSGVLPPAVSAIFGFFLPILMRWLSQYMGALTHSRLDRAVIARYFAFLVVSQLVIFTLIGVIFNSVKEIVLQIGSHKSFNEIIHNLDKLPGTINRTYIDQASYWLTFFPLRGFLVIFDLAQIINLVWLSFKTHVFGRTPRDIREWTQPPDFQYAIYYSNILFMGAVGMVFAPLAPLVALAAAIVFWLSSWVYKYQLMFVFVSKVETGGRLWNVAINRILFTVILMQLLMVLTIGLQFRFRSLQWISTVPPILIIMAFKAYLKSSFDKAFRYYIPTEDDLRQAKVHSESADNRGNRLQKRFGHPALHAELFTPMLHARMMPLLGEVYKGRIDRDQARLDEYGGQKMEAQIVPGGIRIAAIDQRDLEYDPRLYQRDRGELDWDARSVSTNMLGDSPSLHHSKSQFYAHPQASMSGVPGYDRYLAGGAAHSDIELSRLDSTTDQQPLLNTYPSFVDQRLQHPSQFSDPSRPPSMYQVGGEGLREAPVHRPYPPQSRQSSAWQQGANQPPQESYPPHSRQSSAWQQGANQPPQESYPPHSRQSSAWQQGANQPPQEYPTNMAGRGAHMGY
jgi:hypothetical protein